MDESNGGNFGNSGGSGSGNSGSSDASGSNTFSSTSSGGSTGYNSGSTLGSTGSGTNSLGTGVSGTTSGTSGASGISNDNVTSITAGSGESGSGMSAGVFSVLERFGIDQSQISAVRDALKNVHLEDQLDKAKESVSESFGKAREYAKKNPGAVMAGLAVLVIGAGLIAGVGRKDKD